MANLAPTQWGTTVNGQVMDLEVYDSFMIPDNYSPDVLLSRNPLPGFLADLMFSGVFKSQTGTFSIPNEVIFETDPLKMTIEFEAAAAPVIGANAVLTVTANDHDARGNSKYMEGSQVLFPNGAVGTMISHTAVANADVITIAPASATPFPAMPQGFQAPILSGKFGESDLPAKWLPSTGYRAYTFENQYIRDAAQVSWMLMAFDQHGRFNFESIDLPDPFNTGGTVKCYTHQKLTNWKKGVMHKFQNTLMWGQESGQNPSLSDGNSLKGLMPWLKSGAQQFLAPPPGGTYTKADIQLMALAFDRAGFGDTRHVMKLGQFVYDPLNDFILSLGQQDTRQGTLNEYYKFNYKGLKGVGGHDFEYTLINAFNDDLGGLASMGMQYVGLIMPDGTTTMEAARANTTTGGSVPLFALEYQEAWPSMKSSIGSGFWRTHVLKGPRFCGPGESPNYADNKLEIYTEAYVRLVMLQAYRFGLIS